MNHSKHSNIRGQQRGIGNNMVEIILEFGIAKQKPGNAQEYRIDKRTKATLIFMYKQMIKLLENIDKKCVLLSHDDNVITVYNTEN